MSAAVMMVSVVLACTQVGAVGVSRAGGDCDGALDPIVPISVKNCSDAELVRDLRAARTRWGYRRFVLCGPGMELSRFNLDSIEAFRALGERIAHVRESLADTDIELGWWNEPTLRRGADGDETRIVDCDGNRSDAICPLDPAFADRFARSIAETCRIGRPFVVFIEDDFDVSWHRGLNPLGGCFCSRHLAAVSERMGKKLTAAEITEAFRCRTPDNEPIRRTFAEVSKASLVGLARRIRAAIDSVDPTIRVCLCQSYHADTDGDATLALARAFAGGTRPLVRVWGAQYNSENCGPSLPGLLAHAVWSVANLPQDLELVHESDPYPHNRFFKSAAFLGSEISGAFMAGVSDSFLYCSQYLDDPFEDAGYADWFARNRKRLKTVRDFRRRSELVGVGISFDPKEHYLVRSRGGALNALEDFGYFLGRFGFPLTAKMPSVTLLSAQSAERMTDAELRTALSGGVFLDAEAAVAVSRRGLSDLIGVVAEPVDVLPATGEIVLPAANCRRRGKRMNCFMLDPVGGAERGLRARLTVRPGAEVLSEYVDSRGRAVAPSVTFFRNAIGGRSGVMAQGIAGNRSSSVYNSRKQELLVNLFGRLSGETLDVCAAETPSTWLSAAVSSCGDELLVMVDNLSGEERCDVVLRFAGKWSDAKAFNLDPEGEWKPLGQVAGRWKVPLPLPFLKPEFILLQNKRAKGTTGS